MLEAISVEIVIVLHFSFVLFVVFGAFLLLWSRKVIWLHLPAALWGAIVEFTGWICPLTPLENWLRMQAGKPVYDRGFIENYITPILYPDGLTREIQNVLGVTVVVINGLLYWYVFKIRKKR